ncbi:MAG: hypothetical protein COA97_05820 [Flavobacteriales bacterium]|nr:MAG: hypothetical protein COA97_05820 [Flavobacteriales bacterium]
MIFFNIPSVGQLKPSTLFSEDDHFGFIQTIIGKEYNRSNITSECLDYYDKTNDRYWDQIITIINFLGIKKLNPENRFCEIPLLEFVAEKFDSDNKKPSKIIFDYLLSQWQFPHPIVTKNRVINSLDLNMENIRKDFPYTKPYQIILALLKELYLINPSQAYFSNEEFYWFGYHFYKTKAENYNLKSIKKLTKDLLDIRKNGWNLFKGIKDNSGTKTHLSYPKGFLKNSSVLTDDSGFYSNQSDFFIGLKPIGNLLNILNSLIENSGDIFEFDRNLSERDLQLCFDYSEHLYETNRVNNWLRNVEIYDELKNIYSKVKPITKKFDEKIFRRLNIERQLKRLTTLERLTVTRQRTEQHILRAYLLKNKKSGSCAICDKDYPIQFLATAHIKKRKNCSDDEKKDLNVVMPACHLGCDKIYEEGYIYVDKGLIHSNLYGKETTDPLKKYIADLEDKTCNYFNEETANYFKHHAENV